MSEGALAEHLSFGAQSLHYFRREHEGVPREPIEGPAAWLGSELATRDDWIHRFSAAEVADPLSGNAALNAIPVEVLAVG